MRQRPQSRARAVRVVILDDAAHVGEEDVARRARPHDASAEPDGRVIEDVVDRRNERQHKSRCRHARGDEWQRQDEARGRADPTGGDVTQLEGLPHQHLHLADGVSR